MKKVSASILFFFILLTAAVSGTSLVEVTVSVEGLKSDKGFCRLLIYENEEGFPNDPKPAMLISSMEIKNKKTEFTMSIAPGTYAISIMHDENSNEKLDKTWYGKPKEGFGISNNPKVKFGPPSFKESAIKISADNAQFSIKMLYL